MTSHVIGLHHTNVTVPPETEVAAKYFYGSLLGLTEVPKPQALVGRGGAWYQIGPTQLHLSRETGVVNDGAKRHFCLLVADLGQMHHRLESAGIEILPDERPVPGWARFYVRDPGGNLIEIAEDLQSNLLTE